MPAAASSPRIALIGHGAMARYLLPRLRQLLPQATLAVLVRSPVEPPREDVQWLDSAEALYAWQPTLTIECAGHSAVQTYAAPLLRAGCDVILVSVGALADTALHQSLRDSAQTGGSRLYTVAGAIGGLDALAAARSAGLELVRYIGRKPPLAWKDTPAESLFALETLREPVTFFEGSASESARQYPKNANVTAAVALAGVGFEATQVTLIADPGVTQNCHELQVCGAFGEFFIRLANAPLPENRKTSWLAALSIEQEVCNYFGLKQRPSECHLTSGYLQIKTRSSQYRKTD